MPRFTRRSDDPSHVALIATGGCIAAVAAAIIVASPVSAAALVRTCGPDAAANTAAVLCAAPSGPCTDQLVVLSANVSVRNARCEFDLGGRDLRIDKTLQTFGADGFLNGIRGGFVFDNAGAVTVSRHGKLKARGDFIRAVDGSLLEGGDLRITSTAGVTIDGLIDLTGAVGGLLDFVVHDDVVVSRGAKIRARGTEDSRSPDPIADGGELVMTSFTGSIAIHGSVAAAGAAHSAGGDLILAAARTITIDRAMDLSGGDFSGGELDGLAGGSITLGASVAANSRSGGGDGGSIELAAGIPLDPGTFGPPDADDPGILDVSHALLDVRGSAASFVGDGGDVELAAAGPVRVAPDVVIHADGPPTLDDGSGGTIDIESGQDFSGTLIAADLELAGVLSAHGPSAGGAVFLAAGGDLHLTAPIDASGGHFGGELGGDVGGSATLAAPIDLGATNGDGSSGQIEFTAGEIANGTLTIAADIEAAGGQCDGILLSACTLIVSPGVTLDRSCTDAGFEDVMELKARSALQLGDGSRVLADTGDVTTTHPSAVTPAIGANVVITRTRIDRIREVGEVTYPPCAPPG